jgi:glycerophosphoryl diester phosphodiesterase
MQSDVLFSSFDGRAIQCLKRLAPDIPAALLFSRKLAVRADPVQLLQKYNADAFNCTYWQLRKKWLEKLKASNIPVFVYTVDEPARMKKLIERGVDGIFTNRPDVLRSVMNEIKNRDKVRSRE